jgi:hypothetical protein
MILFGQFKEMPAAQTKRSPPRFEFMQTVLANDLFTGTI